MAAASIPPVEQATQIPPVQTQQVPPAAAAPPDPAMQRMQQQLDQQQQTSNAILERLKPQNPQPSGDEMNRSFFKEPVRMSDAIARQAASEVVNQALAGQFDTLIASARAQVRSGNEAIFDKYTQEIEAKVMLVDPQFRTNINVWQNALQMVKGMHLNDILEEDRKASPRAPAVHISNDGGPARSSGHQPPAPKGVELSPEEKSMARGLRIPEDQYLAGKAQLDLSNYGRADSKDNAFDSVVTFDSRERKRNERAAARAKK